MGCLLGYRDLPKDIMNQIDKVVNIWKEHLGDALVGIYLHGSISLHAFNPQSGDIDDYDFHDYDARYFASNILILGRILSFKKEKRILSKYEGGLWMIENVPEKLKYLPECAMAIWFDGEEHLLPEDDLIQLREFLVEAIKG